MKISPFWLLLIWVTPVCAQYTLNGDAQLESDGCYALTQAQNAQLGSLWSDVQISLDEPFQLDFVISLGANDDNGADGIVFVLQSNGLTALGTGGQFIGYDNSISPSFAIEFDTYHNPATGQLNSDPQNDHLAFLRDGVTDHASANNLAGPVDMSSAGGNTEDGLDHIVRFDWDPLTNTMDAYFDCDLRLSLSYDIVQEIFGSTSDVWWGFTSSTGGYNNLHQLKFEQCFLSVDGPHDICAGEAVTINAFSTFNNPNLTESFSWSPASGLDDANAQSPSASPTETTTYQLNYTDACGNVNTDFSVTVNVEAAADASFTLTDFCPGDANAASNIASPGGSFSFNPPVTDGTTIDASNGSISNAIEGSTYTVEYTLTGNCPTSSMETVTIASEVDASFSFEDFCPDAPVAATNIANPGGTFSFNSTPGDGASIDASTGFISSAQAGSTYSILYTSSGNCPSTSIEEVRVLLPEDASFNFADFCSGEANAPTNIASPGGIFTISPPSNDGASIDELTGVLSNAQAEATYNISYSTSGDCPSTVSLQVYVLDCNVEPELVAISLMPNAFSPNNDGINDQFGLISTQQFTDYEMLIFDRWGKLLFSSTDQSSAQWDGSQKGEALAMGVYVYFIRYLDAAGEQQEHKGNVTLIR